MEEDGMNGRGWHGWKRTATFFSRSVKPLFAKVNLRYYKTIR